MSDLDNISISQHAAMRYIERVEPALTVAEARAAIREHSRAIACAAEFGCEYVRLASRARLVLCGWDVVTVLGADQPPGRCSCEVPA